MISLLFYGLLITQSIQVIDASSCSNTTCNLVVDNLLIGREELLSASSTCGLTGPENYCVLSKKMCGMCDSRRPYDKTFGKDSHRIENVISRNPKSYKRWWQSETNKDYVFIQANFETEFLFESTVLRFKTYRPKTMLIERSQDYGLKWRPYAYFSDNCTRDFRTVSTKPRLHIADVNCVSDYSSAIRSEGGSVKFSVIPGGKTLNDFNNDILEYNKFTNLKITFSKLHKFNAINEIKDNNYYALYEWKVMGTCSCHGHAHKCVPRKSQTHKKIKAFEICDCLHNTAGDHCEKCKDYYNDQPWRPRRNNEITECKPCNCNQHSNSCYFSPTIYKQTNSKSGSICNNCQHNTEGRNCENCQASYFRNVNVSITAINTCIKCDCNEAGIRLNCTKEFNSRKQIKAGQCICKQNIDGNKCDSCSVGYFDFKAGCKKCSCTMAGTLNNIGCDKITGSCSCKKNVEGTACNKCKFGFFNLDSTNPDGCKHCGCSFYNSKNSSTCNENSGQCQCNQGYSGRTCDEIKDGWYTKNKPIVLSSDSNKFNLRPVKTLGLYNVVVLFNNSKVSDSGIVSLKLTVFNKPKVSDCKHPYEKEHSIEKEDQVIVMPNICLGPIAKITIKIIVKTVEKAKASDFQIQSILVSPTFDKSKSKTQKMIINCFNDPEYSKQCKSISSNVVTQIGRNNTPKKCNCNVTGSKNYICDKLTGQCKCQPNVDGKQCNKCAPYSYRLSAFGCTKCKCNKMGSLNRDCNDLTAMCLCKNGVIGKYCNKCKIGYGGFPNCKPCMCNNLAKSCEQDGKCINCTKNSAGFNCHQCKKGYYGNIKKGILCKKCKCPGVDLDLDHSKRCDLEPNSNNFVCHCKRGYVGKYCQKCDINYYGNPMEKGGLCKPCNCSGHMDLTVLGNCDRRSGKCLKCMHNTMGFNCERCADGFYGDSAKRNCTKCICNTVGTNKEVGLCNSQTGICNCLPNVIGKNCNRCKDGYYNLESGKGCKPCECSFPNGSKSQSCNQKTGQCDCYKNKWGKKCDECPNKHWGVSGKTGCKKCICMKFGSETEQCDKVTGICKCKNGFVGAKCDRCGSGTFGRYPKCMPCGECGKGWHKRVEQITEINNENIQRYYSSGNQNTSSDFMKMLQLTDKVNFFNTNIKDAEKAVVAYIPSNIINEQSEIIARQIREIETKKIKDAFTIIKNQKEQQSRLDYDLRKAELNDIKKFLNLHEKEIDEFKHQNDTIKQLEPLKPSLNKYSKKETLKAFIFLKNLINTNKQNIRRFQRHICSNAETCNKGECDLNKCTTKHSVPYDTVSGLIDDIKLLQQRIKAKRTSLKRIKMNYDRTEEIWEEAMMNATNYENEIKALNKTRADKLEEIIGMKDALKQLITKDNISKQVTQLKEVQYNYTLEELQTKYDSLSNGYKNLNKVVVKLNNTSEKLLNCQKLESKTDSLKQNISSAVNRKLLEKINKRKIELDAIYKIVLSNYSDFRKLEKIKNRQARSFGIIKQISAILDGIKNIKKRNRDYYDSQLKVIAKQRAEIDNIQLTYTKLNYRRRNLPKTSKQYRKEWQSKLKIFEEGYQTFYEKLMEDKNKTTEVESAVSKIYKHYEASKKKTEKLLNDFKKLPDYFMFRVHGQMRCKPGYELR